MITTAADRIAAATRETLDKIIEEHDSNAPWTWVSADSAARYRAVAEYARRHVIATTHNAVTVLTPDTGDGRLWSHVADEALDRGAVLVFPEASGTVLSRDRGAVYVHPVTA